MWISVISPNRVMCILLVALLAGCQQGPVPGSWEDEERLRPVENSKPNAEARDSAGKLRFGDRNALENAASEADRAALCANALDMVVTRLRQTGQLSSAQIKLIEQMREYYANRAGEGASAPADDQSSETGTGSLRPNEEFEKQAAIAAACLQSTQADLM